ncbi:hypothetical protein ACFOG5_04710 [Pedobacter fastidiosus]|uniref:hypothetical protein n=1 Tax=Pedobacter fastidiosus TaxID=2765361 RepID=UPI0036156DA7
MSANIHHLSIHQFNNRCSVGIIGNFRKIQKQVYQSALGLWKRSVLLLCHSFLFLHTILVIVFFASGYELKDIMSIPFFFRPTKFGFDLWGVYLIWMVVVLALYYPCKWFKKYKETHSQWWLRYI